MTSLHIQLFVSLSLFFVNVRHVPKISYVATKQVYLKYRTCLIISRTRHKVIVALSDLDEFLVSVVVVEDEKQGAEKGHDAADGVSSHRQCQTYLLSPVLFHHFQTNRMIWKEHDPRLKSNDSCAFCSRRFFPEKLRL